MKYVTPTYQITKTKDVVQLCLIKNQTQGFNGMNGQIPMTSSLALFVLQLTLYLVTDRIFVLILKPLRQPPIVAKILCGIALGPSGLAQTNFFASHVIPFGAVPFIETFGGLALVYYMFLVGLEMELNPILKSDRKSFSIALAGMIIPFCTGLVLFFTSFKPEKTDFRGSMFWGVALTATNFPEVSRVLTDLKLLRKETGKLALYISAISDFCSLFLLVLATPLLNNRTYLALLSTIGFVVFSIFIMRPAISEIVQRFFKDENYNDHHIWFILGWVILFSLITDGCGSHSILGSFMFGAIMPRGDMLRFKLVERVDDFVYGIMMPIFFLSNGLRCEFGLVFKNMSWHLILIVIGFSFAAKIVSTVIVSLSCNMPIQEAMLLGFLMNTKGVLALIIVNIGRDVKALDNQSFPLMMLAILVMTFLVEPIIEITYKQERRFMRYKHKTIKSTTAVPNIQFRVLACVPSTRDVSSIISLMEASNATKESPLCVIAAHLVELSGRVSAMLLLHDHLKISGIASSSNRRGRKSKLDQIMDAFKLFEIRNNGVFVQEVIAVSPYETMHKEICSLAQEKHVALVIIPFHTELISDGKIEDPISIFAGVSQFVLANAPCSMGLLVDRGLVSFTLTNTEPAERTDPNDKGLHIAALFIGGPDDREALAYAWRMVGSGFVSLTVMRFIPSKDAAGKSTNLDGSSIDYDHNEQRIDDDYMYEFLMRASNDQCITYIEKEVSDGDETLAAIKDNYVDYDLYIVGRGQKRLRSPLTLGLSEWSRCSELGALGETLTSSSFASQTSILVLQQYIGRSNKASPKGSDIPVDSSPWHPLMDRGNYEDFRTGAGAGAKGRDNKLSYSRLPQR